MAIDWNILSSGQSSIGNPADLGPYRGLVTQTGQKYSDRADDQYDWAKKQFEKNAGVANQVQQQALDTGATFRDWANRDRAMYDQTYVPAMQEQMRYAREYTTPERMAANRAGAITGANIAFDASADAAKRSLMSYGVDPSSGRFAGLDAALQAKRAATAAGLGTRSDRDTEMMGQQLLANAIRTGQVLPGQAANEAGVSLAAGNQAVNTGLATTASGAQTMGTGLQWAGLGNDMMKEWKDSLLNQTRLGLQQNKDVAEERMKQQEIDAKSSSGLGAALGAGAGILGMVGNFAVPGGGSLAGSLLSGALSSGASKAMGGGSGSLFRKGGPVRKFRPGGMVRPENELYGEESEDDRALIQRPYTPDEEDEPARGHRSPADLPYERYGQDWPQSDSATPRDEDEDDDEYTPQRYQEGGYVQHSMTDEDVEARDAANLIPFEEREGVYPPEAGDEPLDEPLAEGVRKGTQLQNDDDRYYYSGPDTHEDEQQRRRGKSPGDELRERIEAQRQQRRLRGYQGGGDVRPPRTAEVNSRVPYKTFNPNGIDYDHATADLEGLGTQIDPEDGLPHNPSRVPSGPAEGMLLKGRMHPTFDKGVDVDRRMGYGLEMRDGRYYTVPFDPAVTARQIWGYAEGGEVDEPEFVDNGMEEMAEPPMQGDVVPPEASPSGGQETDDVHALLNEGEFVIPKDVTAWYGEKYFQNLIQKAYKERSAAQAQGEPATPQQQEAVAMTAPSFESMGA